MDKELLCVLNCVLICQSNRNDDGDLYQCSDNNKSKTLRTQHFQLTVFVYSTRNNEPQSMKAPTRGDDTSQQQLVDFYKTHCTLRE